MHVWYWSQKVWVDDHQRRQECEGGVFAKPCDCESVYTSFKSDRMGRFAIHKHRENLGLSGRGNRLHTGQIVDIEIWLVIYILSSTSCDTTTMDKHIQIPNNWKWAITSELSIACMSATKPLQYILWIKYTVVNPKMDIFPWGLWFLKALMQVYLPLKFYGNSLSCWIYISRLVPVFKTLQWFCCSLYAISEWETDHWGWNKSGGCTVNIQRDEAHIKCN